MSNFVIWPFEISDGDISAAIQNYELPFEPWDLWGLYCSFLSPFTTLEVFGKFHKFEGGDWRLRIPMVPVTKMLLFSSLTILIIITINNCNDCPCQMV